MNAVIISVLVVLGFICIVLLWFALAYNKGIRLNNYKKEAFSTMDIHLKKRWDLIPNLLATTKGYAKHEKSVFEEISKLRGQNYTDLTDNQKLDLNSKLSFGIPKIIAVAENYPELKASNHFSQLSSELARIEDDIAYSRKYYNGCVRELNNFVDCFPTNIIAKIFHFEKSIFFEIDEAHRENIRVEF